MLTTLASTTVLILNEWSSAFFSITITCLQRKSFQKTNFLFKLHIQQLINPVQGSGYLINVNDSLTIHFTCTRTLKLGLKS